MRQSACGTFFFEKGRVEFFVLSANHSEREIPARQDPTVLTHFASQSSASQKRLQRLNQGRNVLRWNKQSRHAIVNEFSVTPHASCITGLPAAIDSRIAFDKLSEFEVTTEISRLAMTLGISIRSPRNCT